jgi:hypothetical protein
MPEKKLRLDEFAGRHPTISDDPENVDYQPEQDESSNHIEGGTREVDKEGFISITVVV